MESALDDGLINDLEEQLTNGILRVVSRAGIEQPVYCLILTYGDDQQHALPPILGIGTVDERSDFTRDPEEGRWLMWTGAEFENYGGRFDYSQEPALLELCKKAYESCGKDAPAMVRTLLCRVARRLNEADWSGSLDTDDDFVVIARDVSGHHLRKNWLACLQEDVIELLAEHGFAPPE